MKKRTAVFLAILLLTFSGCGDASDVGVHITDSQRYSETELNSAVETVKAYFEKDFEDGTLYFIDYNDAQNEREREDNLWRNRRSYEPKTLTDILELTVAYTLNNGSLMADTVYLVKLDDGQWQVGDFGSY